jgi:hypothetical protein
VAEFAESNDFVSKRGVGEKGEYGRVLPVGVGNRGVYVIICFPVDPFAAFAVGCGVAQ